MKFTHEEIMIMLEDDYHGRTNGPDCKEKCENLIYCFTHQMDDILEVIRKDQTDYTLPEEMDLDCILHNLRLCLRNIQLREQDEIVAKIVAESPRGLIIMRGLPAAGKTTFAHNFVRARAAEERSAFRIGRDDIRNLLCLGSAPRKKCIGTREQEDIVTELEEAMIRAMFASGAHWVVEDSTNLYQTSIERLVELAADLSVVPTVITLDTPVGECVALDALREDSVGEDVIRKMATAPGWTVQ
jgi:predicted kinase